MVRVAWLLVLVACAGNREAGDVPPPPAPKIVLLDAPPPLVELLHAVPSSVRVSSQVKNKAIVPAHLVDRDLSTAWNSRTGELAGTWIDVAVARGEIQELRLTVGHTGTGPEGDDYFTMNPRIKAVSLLHGGGVITTVSLDPELRDLQSIVLPAPTTQIRLRIDAVEPGSKKSWREVCISELEAWGTQPAGAVTAHEPEVAVGEPVGPSLAISDLDAYCAGRPLCGITSGRVVAQPPWLSAGVLELKDTSGKTEHFIAIQTAAGWWKPVAITCPSCAVRILGTNISSSGLNVRYVVDGDTVTNYSVSCSFDVHQLRCGNPVEV